MADGSVIVVEIHSGRVTRCWNGRKECIRQSDNGPNGAAIGPDGALYVCYNGGENQANRPGSVERVDLTTGRSETVYDSCDGVPLSAPNDLVFDCDGNIWFTDLGRSSEHSKDFGALYCATADGRSITRIMGKAMSYNGVGLSPDMRTVYVSDTYQGRVYAFDRRCEVQMPRYLATAPATQLLDSMAVTENGNLCIATLMPGGVFVVSPDGQTHAQPFDDAYITNIAFGGPDMQSAWLTFCERGLLVRTRWPEKGLRLTYNA